MIEIKQETYKPTTGMKTAAKRGLEWRKEFKRGGTLVGVARARDIINGKNLPIQTVARMYSFFARHTVDKKASGFNSGEDGFPSNGRIAWDLWGGDSGNTWSKRIWEKYKENNKNITEFEILFDENSSDELIKSILFASKKL